MPIKDPDENRIYQREWQRRKKLGLPTRGFWRKVSLVGGPKKVAKMSAEEKKIKKNENDKRWRRKEAKKRKALIKNSLGKICGFCNTQSGRLIAHRKDGVKHKYFYLLSTSELKDELDSDKYVLVCYLCHKGIHWAMKFLSLDWNQIWHLFKPQNS